MKKYVLALSIVLVALVSFNAEALILRLGGSASTSDPEKVFLSAVNGESYTLSDGTVVAASSTADDGVTVTISAGGDVKSTCVIDQSCAAGAKCRCQVYGLKTNVLVDGSSNATVAGSPVYTSPVAGRSGHVDGGTGSPINAVGIALDAASTSTTLEVFINLL